MIAYVLLDLDNTLYPRTSGLGREMDRRMTDYVSRWLNIPQPEALTLRHRKREEHGTTLQWLVQEYELADVEEFLDAVHPQDLDRYLTERDRAEARRALELISLPASILTNAPLEHARRVLRWLGIEERFDMVFDIRYNSFVGKPHPGVYERAMAELGIEPSRTLYVDDVLQYLLPFRDLGGRVVHLSTETTEFPGIERVGSLAELVALVNSEKVR